MTLIPYPVFNRFGYRVGKAPPMICLWYHGGAGHLLMNTLDGVWVIVTCDENNRNAYS